MIAVQGPFLSGNIVAGVNGTATGYSVFPFGTAPTSRVIRDYNLSAIFDDSSVPTRTFAIVTLGPAIAQDYINGISINGVSLLTSAATSFVFSSGIGTWKWNGSWGLSNGSTYAFVIS